MIPPESGREEHAHEEALRSVEERVQRVQHLAPFRFSKREDGRFHCGLEKPIDELSADETREALSVLGEIRELMQGHLDELEEGGA